YRIVWIMHVVLTRVVISRGAGVRETSTRRDDCATRLGSGPGRQSVCHRRRGADRVVDGGVDLRLLGDDQSAGDPDNPAIGGVLAVPRLARGFRAIAAIVKQARHETDQVLCSLEASRGTRQPGRRPARTGRLARGG